MALRHHAALRRPLALCALPGNGDLALKQLMRRAAGPTAGVQDWASTPDAQAAPPGDEPVWTDTALFFSSP